MDKSRILLVEDEKNVGLTLVECLEREGFAVTWCTELEQAKDWINTLDFDLALLDVGLPTGSGFDVAEFLSSKQPGAGIIFLTAFGTPEDRIHGLELGAEDYVVKPFHLKELILRIHNGLKRSKNLLKKNEKGFEIESIGKARIHFLRFEAEINGQFVSLSHKEIALLRLLLERRGCVVSRDDILNYAWSDDEYPTPRTVDNFIMRLRRLVEVNPEEPQIIKSIRGIGYQLL